jgi:hypothetical protein
LRYCRAQLHIVAAGFRFRYELLTGDLSQVNYSSIRAGLVEFRRLTDAVQWQIVIPVLPQREGARLGPLIEWMRERLHEELPLRLLAVRVAKALGSAEHEAGLPREQFAAATSGTQVAEK